MFLLPLAVLISQYRDPTKTFDLAFNFVEALAIFIAPPLLWKIVSDGETSFVEGQLLVTLYILIDVFFYGYQL